MDKQDAFDRVVQDLLHKGGWRYLRYLHAREAMLLVPRTTSVLVIGAGYGLAEIALALEFPEMRFHLTDYQGATHTTDRARYYVEQAGLANVSFGQFDVLAESEPASWDMVYSVEVLEHIQDDVRAAANMCAMARQYVFALVPFAEDARNRNGRLRQRAFDRHEHYVVGYDTRRLVELFPNPVAIRGTYWSDAGQPFRQMLGDLPSEERVTRTEQLKGLAQADLRPILPVTMDEALGIWTLARVQG